MHVAMSTQGISDLLRCDVMLVVFPTPLLEVVLYLSPFVCLFLSLFATVPAVPGTLSYDHKLL